MNNWTTLFCLISVGYHLKLRFGYNFLLRLMFFTQLKWADSMHAHQEYDVT